MTSEKDLEAGLGSQAGSGSFNGTLGEKDAEQPSTKHSDDGIAEQDEKAQRKSDGDVESSQVVGPDPEYDTIERPQTRESRPSLKNKLSKIKSFASSKRSKKEKLPPVTFPTSDLGNGVVGWEGQDDPENPMNFNPRRRWSIVAFLSGITFMTPFASSILAPAIEFLNEDFGETDLTVGSFPVSIYLLGYAVGPLLLAPLSELYGRHIVLSSANAFFCAWLIGCALAPSLDSLIVFRFFAGVGGSGCLTIGGGIISDLIPVEKRGKALTAWMIGPLLGPTIGPLVGAFVAQNIGWRWISWIVFIPATAMTVVLAIFSRETNPRVLIKRKVARLSKELNRTDLRSCFDDPNSHKQTKAKVLLDSLKRPLKMLILSPMIFGLSLYVAFAYGVLYLLFNTIPMVFRGTYGFSIGLTGLVYLPLGLGYIIGMLLFVRISDKTVVRMTKANNGVYEPEMRLPDCIWFAMLLPTTFFWYGWSAHFHTHWIVPILGLVPFGIGIVGVWQPIQAYLIDAYPMYAASALAAFTVFRSVVAAFLPLAGPQMYATLGLGWGNSLLGFIAVGLIPVPALIYKFGGRLRKAQTFKL